VGALEIADIWSDPLPVCCLVSAACCLLPAACCLLPAACCLLPAACCLLPAACCLLFAACCLLPAACCLLPAARCLLPAGLHAIIETPRPHHHACKSNLNNLHPYTQTRLIDIFGGAAVIDPIDYYAAAQPQLQAPAYGTKVAGKQSLAPPVVLEAVL
jgi:hypothetical protein